MPTILHTHATAVPSVARGTIVVPRFSPRVRRVSLRAAVRTYAEHPHGSSGGGHGHGHGSMGSATGKKKQPTPTGASAPPHPHPTISHHRPLYPPLSYILLSLLCFAFLFFIQSSTTHLVYFLGFLSIDRALTLLYPIPRSFVRDLNPGPVFHI